MHPENQKEVETGQAVLVHRTKLEESLVVVSSLSKAAGIETRDGAIRMIRSIARFESYVQV
jgi:hypothetical protein